MLALTFEDNGKQKTIERKLFVRCYACGAALECPADEDEWAWLNQGQGATFLAEHRAHGNAAIAEIVHIERD